MQAFLAIKHARILWTNEHATCSPPINSRKFGNTITYINQTHTGISFSNDDADENARIFLKLFVFLYADDTVILADTAEDLQNALNNHQLYCNT